jgi:hypothetical protein
MQKKSLRRRKHSKAVEEWLAEFIREEVRHGLDPKEARKRGTEVIHTIRLITEPKYSNV